MQGERIPMMIRRIQILAGIALLALSTMACATEVGDNVSTGDTDPNGDTGDTVSTGEAALSRSCTISRSQILASVTAGRKRAIERGFTWFDDGVAYSKVRTHDGYRTDCSGFVSMAWELDQSYTTLGFSTGGAESHKLTSYSELLPGDALVRRVDGAGHIVMFLGWNDAVKSSACVLEEASTASDMQFRSRDTGSLHSNSYNPIRADKF